MRDTRQQFEAIENKNTQLVARLDLYKLAIKALEDQNGLLFKRMESDSALLKSLEAKNVQLAKNVEIERLRVQRLTGICIAIGLIAAAVLAMVVRLSPIE